jgi:hypothetical protein
MKCDKATMEHLQKELDGVQANLDFSMDPTVGVRSSIQKLKNVVRFLLENVVWDDGPPPLQHENGHCWCGTYHEVKIT